MRYTHDCPLCGGYFGSWRRTLPEDSPGWEITPYDPDSGGGALGWAICPCTKGGYIRVATEQRFDMKVISYANTTTPMNVQKGTTTQFTVEVAADGDHDLTIAYVVLLGYDDISELSSDFDISAKVIGRLQEENAELRRRVDELEFAELICIQQGEELERLRG